MNHITSRSITRIALATSVWLAASTVYAATGFTVSKMQETQITVGMSRANVQSLLGRPSHNMKFINEPGRTWTYGVIGNGVAENTVFDVDFSADGQVLSSSERIEQMPSSNK